MSGLEVNSMVAEIWYTFCPVITASVIALEKGWLEKEFAGHGIKISHISTLPIAEWQSHYTHKHAQLFRDGGNVPPIWTRAEGVDTTVISMAWDESGQVILVKPDSPITSVKELKSRRIALPRWLPSLIDFRRATTQRGIIMSLKAHGLTPDDIHFVDIPINLPDIATEATAHKSGSRTIVSKTGWKMPQQPEVEALHKGEVDAMCTTGALGFVLEQMGLARIIYNLNQQSDWRYQVNLGQPVVLTVNTQFTIEFPELVTRWMKVSVRAGLWAKDNYAEVVRIAAKALHISEEGVRKIHPPDFHQRLVPWISPRGVKALDMEKDFLREHGFINNDYDVKSWVDSRLVDAALAEVPAEKQA